MYINSYTIYTPALSVSIATMKVRVPVTDTGLGRVCCGTKTSQNQSMSLRPMLVCGEVIIREGCRREDTEGGREGEGGVGMFLTSIRATILKPTT